MEEQGVAARIKGQDIGVGSQPQPGRIGLAELGICVRRMPVFC